MKTSVSGAVLKDNVPAGGLDFVLEVIPKRGYLHPVVAAGDEQVQLPADLGLTDQGLPSLYRLMALSYDEKNVLKNI